MLTRREKTGVWIAVVAIVFVASFCGSVNEICQETAKGEAICPQYHLIPYIFWRTVSAADAHEGFVAFLTGVAVAAFTLGLVILGFKADRHFRITERAYVKMSHEPPGVHWITPNNDMFEVLIRIKNHGKTPAKVTDVRIKHAVIRHRAQLDDIPDYSVDNPPDPPVTAFLVADDKFFWRKNFEISVAQYARIDALLDDLVVYGYVEYVDRFDRKHQARYARVYAADIKFLEAFPGTVTDKPRNNLNMVTQSGYNDDVEIA